MTATAAALIVVALGAIAFLGKRALVGPQKILARVAIVCYPTGLLLDGVAASSSSTAWAPLATVFLLLGVAAAATMLVTDVWSTYKKSPPDNR